MTLDEARDRIGCSVVYRPSHVPPTEPGEEGVITSVNGSFVFVRYGVHNNSAATPAHCLELVSR